MLENLIWVSGKSILMTSVFISSFDCTYKSDSFFLVFLQVNLLGTSLQFSSLKKTNRKGRGQPDDAAVAEVLFPSSLTVKPCVLSLSHRDEDEETGALSLSRRVNRRPKSERKLRERGREGRRFSK